MGFNLGQGTRLGGALSGRQGQSMVRTGSEYFDHTAEDRQSSDSFSYFYHYSYSYTYKYKYSYSYSYSYPPRRTYDLAAVALENPWVVASRAPSIPRRWCPGRWAADPALPDGSRGGRGGRGEPRRS